MAVTWTPLSLSPVNHPVAPDFLNSPSDLKASLNTEFMDNFAEALPGCNNQNMFGVTYAVYSLTPLGQDSIEELIQTFRKDRNYESWRSKIALAPKFDFSNETLREIYDYHVRLVDQGMHATVCSNKFIVVTHSNWSSNGVLLTDLTCREAHIGGSIGFVRIGASTMTQSLMMLEVSGRCWNDLKKHELKTRWPNPIVGYTGSKYEDPGGILNAHSQVISLQ